MYSLEDIIKSLENDKLSLTLYKIRRFAQEKNLTDLEKWSSWELEGYPKGDEVSKEEEAKILKYRTIDVEWKDIYGRMIIIPPIYSFIQKLPFWLGVSDLEGFLDEGCSYACPDFSETVNRFSTVPVGNPRISSQSLKRLFERIHFEARSRVDDYVKQSKSEPSPMKNDLPKFDVLLITVNDHEFESVLKYAKKAIGKNPEEHLGSRVYYDLGVIGRVRTALVRSEMGSLQPGAALATTLKAMHELQPKYIIAVGIMFGVSSEKQEIGQILYSKQIQLYEVQKIATEENASSVRVIPRGDKVTANPQLLSRVSASAYSWSKKFNEKIPSPELILSGEKLIDNINFRDELINIFPEAKGGEMEASGIYAAAREDETRWIIIKAICDYADGKKSEDKEKRQKLAANKAANFVFYLLESGSLA